MPDPHRRAAEPSSSVEVELARRLGRGEELLLATVIRLDGEPPALPGAKLLISRTALLAGTLGCSEFDSAALADASAVIDSGSSQLRTYRHDLGSIEVYMEPHASAPALLVCAATPVARALIRWAPELGFRTLFLETRQERLEGGEWPAAMVDLKSLAAQLEPGAFVVLTDHDAPDVVPILEAVVPSSPAFIGIVGSRRHTGHHLEALRARGVPESVIERIQSPIGLDLGGRGEAEIALSILAGLVAIRRGGKGGFKHRLPSG